VVGGSSDTVLIAEDDVQLRRGIARAVRRLLTPIECGTYEHAVAELGRMTARPRALIVDIHLGSNKGGDGIDLAAHAHRRFGANIPTLVLTGHSSVANLTARAHSIRAAFLYKPQNVETIQLFLERAIVENTWDVPDIIDLDGALARFAATHALSKRQEQFLFTLMRAAERGERVQINPNTRKAGIRRILAKTGHATFDDVRAAIKREAAAPIGRHSPP
jgi:DNA-binding NtrC family response regulator